jgi:DNA-binding IclR family transcriptional regulator
LTSIRYLRAGAVGTREHIIAYLADNTELFDPGGMASTRLAAAVGYPGSSVAFAQLLSGMERSGLIERDVRGKRTYRIGLGSMAGADQAGEGSAVGFDYDELARRLLAQVGASLGVSRLPACRGRSVPADRAGTVPRRRSRDRRAE